MLHERPGHLMLTSAFHDLTDIARLELQPLRSTTSSREPEEAALGQSKGGDASQWKARTPGHLENLESGVSPEDGEAGKEPHRQGRLRNGYNALHNGRTDSAADFGVAHAHGSSGPSSLAVSTCGSEESELLSIREHGPDQTLYGHSPAEDGSDQDRNIYNSSSSFCAPAPSSTSAQMGPGQQSSHSGNTSAELSHQSAPPRSVNGVSSPAWLTESNKMVSGRPPDAEHCSSSLPAAPQIRQQDHLHCSPSNTTSPRGGRRRGLCDLCRGAARWCRSVPWSQVESPPSCRTSSQSTCSMVLCESPPSGVA